MEKKMLKDSTNLVTGGTGCFDNTFLPTTLAKFNHKEYYFLWDEMKQWDKAKKFERDGRVRFLLEILEIKTGYSKH